MGSTWVCTALTWYADPPTFPAAVSTNTSTDPSTVPFPGSTQLVLIFVALSHHFTRSMALRAHTSKGAHLSKHIVTGPPGRPNEIRAEISKSSFLLSILSINSLLDSLGCVIPWCSSPDCLADRSIGKAACPRLSTLIALVRPPALLCANARHGTASTVGTMVKLKQSDVLNVSDHATFPAWPHAAYSSTWLGFTCLGNQTKQWALEFVSISNHTARVLQQPLNL